MSFESKAQENAYHKVRKLMEDSLGMEPFQERAGVPMFMYLGMDPDDPEHPVLLMITIAPSGEDALITVSAPVVEDVEASPELTHYLLRENNTLFFAAFSLDANDNVVCDHTLLASTLDPEELRTIVIEVGNTVHHYANGIIARFGGTKHAVALQVDIRP